MDLEIKDIPEELKKLEDNRALILLVELMGFLHDLGKLTTPKSVEEPFKDHGKQYKKDKEEGIVDKDLKEIFEKSFPELLKDEIIDEGILKQFKGIAIENFQNHHKPSNWIEQLISLADKKDSSEDRGKATRKQIKYRASVFGKESPLPSTLNNERYNLYSKLTNCFKKWNFKIVNDKDFWIILRNAIINLMKEFFSKGVGDTRRASNDVTLFDHSYMTGSISKALVTKVIINPKSHVSFQPNTNKEHFDKECDLDLFTVSFNGFGFISGGINLLDIRGRSKILEEIKNTVKNLLEIKFPLGNCIYEDENNLCFLIAPLENKSLVYLKGEVHRIFNEKTFGILVPTIGRRQNLRYYGKSLVKIKEDNEKFVRGGFFKDFIPEWIKKWENSNGKEKCVICGKLPQWKGKEGDYLCEFCWNLRYKVKEKSEGEDSLWIDEIADENGKIAFVVGSFHPLDKWLSGEFLNCQYIRTLEDIDGASLSFLDVAIKFAEKFYDEMNSKGDFITSLRIPIYKLNNLSEEEKRILGGGSKVGEIYYRLSEDSQTLLKEKNQLSEEEINKIAQEVVDVTTKKPPSPSRLYRIWRELEDFSEEAIRYSRGKMLKGKRLKFELKNFKREVGIYEAEIQGIGRIEVFHGGDGKFSTIERIDKNNPSDEIQENYLKNHEQIIEKAKRKKKTSIFKDKRKINEFEVEFEREGEYKQFREVLSSPNGFIFILPAKRAFEVIRVIKEKFEIQFSKVLGKISLNIGIVYSHRKKPIYISLDAVRRFRDEFKFDEEEGYIAVEKQHLCKISKNANKEHLYQYLVVPIKVKGKEIFWKVHHTLGDGNIDWYYPYFTSSNKLLHITDVTFNDKLNIYLNYLDFEYLDTTTRRFDIVLGEDKKRTYPIVGSKGPRPYLLEDVDKFERLKEIFEKRIGSWTPIRDIEALAASKRQEWSEKGELGDRKAIYEELIDSALENKLRRFFDGKNWGNNVKPFLLSCIMEGTFFDAIELFESIMKMELKGGRG